MNLIKERGEILQILAMPAVKAMERDEQKQLIANLSTLTNGYERFLTDSKLRTERIKLNTKGGDLYGEMKEKPDGGEKHPPLTTKDTHTQKNVKPNKKDQLNLWDTK